LTFLLDVNVLIALIDLTHLNHDPVHAWFAADGHHSWATCPITENGLSAHRCRPASQVGRPGGSRKEGLLF
jgi:predicted nucleic acid-binding protein